MSSQQNDNDDVRPKRYSRYCYQDTTRILGAYLFQLNNFEKENYWKPSTVSRCRNVVRDIILEFGKMYEQDNENFDWQRYYKNAEKHEKEGNTK